MDCDDCGFTQYAQCHELTRVVVLTPVCCESWCSDLSLSSLPTPASVRVDFLLAEPPGTGPDAHLRAGHRASAPAAESTDANCTCRFRLVTRAHVPDQDIRRRMMTFLDISLLGSLGATQ